MRLDCVFAGLNTIDAIALTDHRPDEDEKTRASIILTDGGGPAATAACAFSKAGGKAAMLTILGRDHWTEFALSQLRRHGVDCSLVRTDAGLRNPLSLILVNKRNASRTIIWNSQGLSGKRLRPTKAELNKIFSARCLHFDGHLMPDSIALAAEARKRGVLVSYDCGSAKKGWQKLAANTDFFIASHRFASDLGLAPAKAAASLRKRFGFHVAVTCGEKGVYYFCEKSGTVKLLRQRKYKALDTTGCGDVFHGAFLAHYLKRGDFEKSLAFAQKTAGLKTWGLGGRASIPEFKP